MRQGGPGRPEWGPCVRISPRVAGAGRDSLGKQAPWPPPCALDRQDLVLNVHKSPPQSLSSTRPQAPLPAPLIKRASTGHGAPGQRQRRPGPAAGAGRGRRLQPAPAGAPALLHAGHGGGRCPDGAGRARGAENAAHFAELRWRPSEGMVGLGLERQGRASSLEYGDLAVWHPGLLPQGYGRDSNAARPTAGARPLVPAWLAVSPCHTPPPAREGGRWRLASSATAAQHCLTVCALCALSQVNPFKSHRIDPPDNTVTTNKVPPPAGRAGAGGRRRQAAY